MPKPIKSQETHDNRFNADKENFRQKYGRMSLEEIAQSSKRMLSKNKWGKKK